MTTSGNGTKLPRFGQRIARTVQAEPIDGRAVYPTPERQELWRKQREAQQVDPIERAVREGANLRLLTPADVATMLGIGVRTLERWRCTGEGPRFVALSRKSIRYAP